MFYSLKSFAALQNLVKLSLHCKPCIKLFFFMNIFFTRQDYVHRVGRTARAGRAGRAVTLVTPTDVGLLQVSVLIKLKYHSL